MNLKMDDNGEVYHDDLDGNRVYPSLGQDGNVQSLSITEDPKVLADRDKYDYNVRRQAEARAAKKVNQQLADQAHDQRALQMGEVIYNQNVFMAKALNEQYAAPRFGAPNPATDYSDMGSEVSGHLLTSDGRKPRPDRPPSDWAPQVAADYAFGSYDEGAADFEGGPTEDVIFETVTMGPFTTEDQKIINTWKNNKTNVPFGAAGGDNKPWNMVIDWTTKSNMENWQKEYVSPATKAQYDSQGWAYSGYYEDGEFKIVKVKNIFGLPKIDINVKEGTPEFDKHEKWLDFPIKGHIYSASNFKDLSHVIKAFAKQFLMEHEEAPTPEKLVSQTDEITKPTSDSIFDRLKWLFTGGGGSSYAHPMVQHKLIKRK